MSEAFSKFGRMLDGGIESTGDIEKVNGTRARSLMNRSNDFIDYDGVHREIVTNEYAIYRVEDTDPRWEDEVYVMVEEQGEPSGTSLINAEAQAIHVVDDFEELNDITLALDYDKSKDRL